MVDNKDDKGVDMLCFKDIGDKKECFKGIGDKKGCGKAIMINNNHVYTCGKRDLMLKDNYAYCDNCIKKQSFSNVLLVVIWSVAFIGGVVW